MLILCLIRKETFFIFITYCNKCNKNIWLINIMYYITFKGNNILVIISLTKIILSIKFCCYQIDQFTLLYWSPFSHCSYNNPIQKVVDLNKFASIFVTGMTLFNGFISVLLFIYVVIGLPITLSCSIKMTVKNKGDYYRFCLQD